MIRRITVAVALVTAALVAYAQEHPEHPTNKQAQKKGYTVDQLATAITNEIETTQKKNNGVYSMKDDKADKTWSMKLDKVHRERLARIDENTYFACTDFKSDDNHTVDVDFFMKDDGGKLVLSDATIHKVDGKPRYNWKEKDGFWVRVAAE